MERTAERGSGDQQRSLLGPFAYPPPYPADPPLLCQVSAIGHVRGEGTLGLGLGSVAGRAAARNLHPHGPLLLSPFSTPTISPSPGSPALSSLSSGSELRHAAASCAESWRRRKQDEMERQTPSFIFIFARTPPYANIRVPLPIRGPQAAMGVGGSVRILPQRSSMGSGSLLPFWGSPWGGGESPQLPRSVAN